ncbi:VOC family protein [Streptomyces griseorubiginosus]|uniref:VOC family protein n=1 Tax=Streptomyces griseorubiginosus TaxID=67304 RepID=UPI003644B303
MSGLIPVDRLYSIGVVVRDLRAATRRYAELFGIDEWEVRDFGPERVTAATAHGRQVTPTFRTATGTSVPPGEGTSLMGNPIIPVTFELVQPLTGESPFQEFRFVRGQGVSHLTLAVRDREEFGRLRARLEAEGLSLAGSLTLDDRLERHFVDTRSTLGGYLVEIRVPLAGDGALEVNEHWDHSGGYTRPEGREPLGLSGVNHLGIVVQDVMAALPHYDRLLGVPAWKMRDWRTEKDRLEQPHYRGESVDHEYFTARAQIADFGFEIIQPTLGPSHYNREFGDRFGSGVHHLMLHMTDDEKAWHEDQQWLVDSGVPLAMGAVLYGGGVEFAYLDTTANLGGFVLESVLMKGPLDRELMKPDYVIDFSA